MGWFLGCTHVFVHITVLEIGTMKFLLVGDFIYRVGKSRFIVVST